MHRFLKMYEFKMYAGVLPLRTINENKIIILFVGNDAIKLLYCFSRTNVVKKSS